MKILQYNVWNGCQEDPERFARFSQWLKNQAYDVVGLNELNGWNQMPGMRKRGEDLGYSHAELFVTQRSRTFVGILSKHPIKLVETREIPFHHGVLHVCIRNVHYLITHLTSVEATDREREAMVLAEMVRSISGALVLMGDMNTLSSLDQEQYMADKLVEVLRCKHNLRCKFLANSQTINYKPMQRLLDAGLTDLCAGIKGNYSVPTAVNQDESHATQMRIDYILVNDTFLNWSPKAQILHNDQVDVLSDHYPVECTWEK